MIDVLPAILSHTREDLHEKIAKIPAAKALHIDLMDGRFVDNATVGTNDCDGLPADKIIEYHLMVREPVEWMRELAGGRERIYVVHFEALEAAGPGTLEEALATAKEMDGELGIAINPPTPVEKLAKMLSDNPDIAQALVMTVNPGWAGQSYISEMEEKMRFLRARHPKLTIEVDGGVGPKTAPGAAKAGANRFAAANALFKAPDANQAYRDLVRLLNP
ncbi:MAG: hypothetical protein KGH63_01360 [Candidatus Micrarchaeota archaeon]|nr:hypothetical protein [Candidatus Micrarchaeota archaeon]